MRYVTYKSVSAALVTLAMAGVAATASANTWQQNHPRRTEVNHRLAHQNHRIHQDVKNGTMTKAQAASAHKDDHQVRQEERDMASQNGGHITKSEDRSLNQQENGISRDIPPK